LKPLLNFYKDHFDLFFGVSRSRWRQSYHELKIWRDSNNSIKASIRVSSDDERKKPAGITQPLPAFVFDKKKLRRCFDLYLNHSVEPRDIR